MTNIFKKSLASVLALALCLSALVTAATAVAADGETTTALTATLNIVVSNTEPKPGETVNVKVQTGDNFDQIAGIDLDMVLPVAPVDDKVTLNLTKAATDKGDIELTYNKDTKEVKLVGTTPSENDVFDALSSVLNDGKTIFEFDFVAGEAGETYEFSYSNDTKVRFCTSGEEKVTVTAESKTVTVAENEPVCEHDYQFESAVPATADAEGSITFKCSKCGETKTETVAYNAYTTPAQFSAACESQILLQFDVWTSLFTANSDVSTTLFVLEKENNAADATEPDITVMTPADATEFTSQGKPAYRFYSGIAAMMLNDTFKATVYCQADGVWYNGIVYTSTYVDYAKQMLAKSGTADALKTLFVDLLNYGSSAQTTFNYNAAKLANADIADYQSYATVADPDAANLTNLDYKLEAGRFIPASYSLMAESNVQIRFAFMPYSYTPDADNVRIHFEYTDLKGNNQAYDYYSYDKLVADGETDKIANGEYFTVVGGRYYVDFAKLAAPECDIPVTVSIFDGSRPDTADATVVYSISSYVSTQRDAAAENITLINNLYKYCKAALAYFG